MSYELYGQYFPYYKLDLKLIYKYNHNPKKNIKSTNILNTMYGCDFLLFSKSLTVDVFMAYLLMLVSMTLTFILLQGRFDDLNLYFAARSFR